MKTIVLLRHAKSAWDQPQISDHERPLADRGRNAAPKMATRLADLALPLDVILCSTSRRTRQTFSLMSAVLSMHAKTVSFLDSLYSADADTILAHIWSLPASLHSCCVIGHNPGLTDVLQRITRAGIDNIPTCGIAVVECNVENWEDVKEGELRSFITPKQVIE